MENSVAIANRRSNKKQLNELLSRLRIDKVLFGSRPLFQAPPDDAIETESQARKPKTPVRQTVTSERPMLRIVGRNRVELVDRFFDQWAPIIVRWINDGLTPIVFTQAPDDAKAPELARRLLATLQTLLPAFDLTLPRPTPSVTQLNFLDE